MKKYFIPILSVDDEYPTPEEMGDIRNSVCNNCEEFYVHGDIIRFVRLDSGKLIWWHINVQCKPHEKSN